MADLIYPLTCALAAPVLGVSPSTVSRTAAAHSIGRVVGRQRLLSAADVRRLRKLIRGKPGNPAFTPGNQIARKQPKSEKSPQ